MFYPPLCTWNLGILVYMKIEAGECTDASLGYFVFLIGPVIILFGPVIICKNKRWKISEKGLGYSNFRING